MAMLRISNLFVAALITTTLSGFAFSQTQQIEESSDPYFTPRKPQVQPKQSSSADLFAAETPAPKQITAPKQKTASTPNDFRPPSVAGQGSTKRPVFDAQKPDRSFNPSGSASRKVAESTGSQTRSSGSNFAAPSGSNTKSDSGSSSRSQSASNSGSGSRSGSDSRSQSTSSGGSGSRSVAAAKDSTGEQSESSSSNEFALGQVVAIVGGEPIFVGDMMFEANQIIEERASHAPEDVKKQLRNTLIKRLVPKFVDSKMLWTDTLASIPAEADIDAIVESASAEFDANALPKIMKKAGVESAQQFDANLRSQGSSLRKFRSDWAKEQLMRYFMTQKLQVDTDISHDELLSYYRANQEGYFKKARVRWEELSIRYSKTPDRDEARRMITELGNEVVYGAPFEAVAKRSSHGFTALEGGQHDWIGKGALVYTKVSDTLFTIPVGELSEIIESRDGLHIVRVIEREDDSVTPFTEAQAGIRKKLESEKRGAAFEEHLTKLRKRVPFEILLPDVELPPYLAEQSQTNGSNGSNNWK